MHKQKRGIGSLVKVWLPIVVVSLMLVGCDGISIFGISVGKFTEVEEQSFDLGSSPSLNLENFGGNVVLVLSYVGVMSEIANYSLNISALEHWCDHHQVPGVGARDERVVKEEDISRLHLYRVFLTVGEESPYC